MAERDMASEKGSALDKALAVLEAVAEQSQPIGLPDLSSRLKLPRQTVHRVLLQLEAAGLLRRDSGRDRFSIGPRFSALALRALYTRNQSAPIRTILQCLVDDIEETCNIGILDGLDFLYVERIECAWSLRVHLQAGSKLPAHTTSGGKVMLAYLDDRLRGNLLKGSKLKAYTENTRTLVADLESEFAEIRQQGYALNDQEFSIGIVGAAVPIRDRDGRVIAALATHGPAPRLDIARAKDLLPRMNEAARALTRAWGLDSASSKPPVRVVTERA